MESLLCNEQMSPNVQENDGFISKYHLLNSLIFSSEEDCGEAFSIFLGKEARFLPEPGFLKLVMTHDLFRHARVKAVNWIIKTQRRLDLSLETVFMAVNYLDRFVSLNQCHGWKCWMFELLSMACLSVSSKFNETTTHLLYEFQMEDLENSFAPTLIQRMELTLLKALGWRMDSTTPFSYIHLLVRSIDVVLNKNLVEGFTKRVTEVLLNALLDPKFLEFKQCVVAMSAVRCVLEQDLLIPSTNIASLAHLHTLITQKHKGELVKCQMMMGKLMLQNHYILGSGNSWQSPSSPVTVLKVELFDFYHLSLVKTSMDSRSSRKRKREELDCEMVIN